MHKRDKGTTVCSEVSDLVYQLRLRFGFRPRDSTYLIKAVFRVGNQQKNSTFREVRKVAKENFILTRLSDHRPTNVFAINRLAHTWNRDELVHFQQTRSL